MPRAPFPVGGYVLAGGKSSRMGRDKALLELAGQPLIWHAANKLRQVCVDVRVLSDNPELAAFAPLVADLHPGCGPIGGMEAGLTHSTFDWNLFLAVDMAFVPAAFLASWLERCLSETDSAARVCMVAVDGRPQPGLCLLHKEVLPFLSEAIERGSFKLLTALQSAGEWVARRGGNAPEAGVETLDGARVGAEPLWFANLNTAEDFAAAQAHGEALDL